MSIYKCANCDNIIDADYSGCNENPFDNTTCICDNCADINMEELKKFDKNI